MYNLKVKNPKTRAKEKHNLTGTKQGQQQRQLGTAQCLGIKQGQPGIKQGQPGTKQGQPGTKQGQPGTKKGQPGTKQGQPGTKQGQGHNWTNARILIIFVGK